MSEETTNGAVAPAEAATGNTGTAFTVEKIYAKDVSFEVPGGPAVFNEQAQPQLQMNLSQSVQRLGENAYEVVLGITLTCNANDKPMYVAEVFTGKPGNYTSLEETITSFERIVSGEGLVKFGASGDPTLGLVDLPAADWTLRWLDPAAGSVQRDRRTEADVWPGEPLRCGASELEP